MSRFYIAGNILMIVIGVAFANGVDWKMVYFVFNAAWSVFWSYAPTPQPETWYNAVFHLAQWVAWNPGRSLAVAREQERAKHQLELMRERLRTETP
jgi:hypothetical protein